MLATAERSYYGGDMIRAYQFADQARKDLPDGSREWLRASDIVAAVDAEMDANPNAFRRRE
jgi:predicted Zn-dependent protease